VLQIADAIADHQGYALVPVETETAQNSRDLLDQIGLGRHADKLIADFESEVSGLLAAL
jgi:hypothetical protein